jgi:hypothetical protein
MAKRSTKLTKRSTEQSFFNGYEGTNVARDAKKKGSGNSQQGGAASKANPTDFYGPGGMLPKAKLVRGA